MCFVTVKPVTLWKEDKQRRTNQTKSTLFVQEKEGIVNDYTKYSQNHLGMPYRKGNQDFLSYIFYS
jgi:hypothetical protein